MQNKNSVLVVGVNARPIVSSLKLLGLDIYAVDYWGDIDLREKVKDLFVIKENEDYFAKLGDEGASFADKLYIFAEKMIDQHPEISKIYIGSGLDDRPDLWKKLSNKREIIGNKPNNIKYIRDRFNVYSLLEDLEINAPRTVIIRKEKDLKNFCLKVGFPVVIRSNVSSGGGREIYKINSKNEIKKTWRSLSSNKKIDEIIAQEFIEGLDISVTSLNNKKDVHIISVNEQLIGMKEAGAPYPFAYCGNIIPANLSKKVIKKVKKNSKQLLEKLNLHGINGMDLKIDGNDLYFMEINPRFPGTIEIIEMMTQTNIIDIHNRAYNGEIVPISIPEKKFGIKIIPYSKNTMNMKKLDDSSNYYYDIPMENEIIEKNDPILTIQIIGNNRKNIIKKAFKIIENLYLF
ncbi:MAG: ATP-grasp domain-containing protein [Candidatus Lokiarchaeota archaeon]|nr:ATP-grasp domain-containing protein [Candidatus Lokiarchaeota archaeon]